MTNVYPERIVSLQPSVTVTLAAIGALPRVVACTKYCVDVCPEIKGMGITVVQDSWTAQADQILMAKPDLVIASVPYQLESLAQILKSRVPFLALTPTSLADICSDITLISRVVALPEEGLCLIAAMRLEIEEITRQCASPAKTRVFCEEWGKPIISSQPWIAELIEAAGGQFIGAPGKQISTEEVAALDPDVIIAAWCGAGDRVPIEKLVSQRGWQNTSAARNGRVFCISDELMNTPAHTLVGGLRAIAWALHPERFAKPIGIRQINEIRA